MPSSTRITSFAFLIYAPLSVGALAWAWFGQGRWAWSLSSPWMSASYVERLLASLGLGLGLALLVIISTPWLLRHAAWARELHQEMKPIIDDLSAAEILVLAIASGTAEELFFRGAMQPVLGLLATSLIFGAVHTGPKRVFLWWSAWAFLVGILFGMIFEATGVLAGPVLAHVWVNQRNITFMKGH